MERKLREKSKKSRVGVGEAGSAAAATITPLKHMDHSPSRLRVNRAKGQIEAIGRMIDEKRYCPEIIYQIRAATNALKALENEILRRHLKGCVKNAFEVQNAFEVEEKIEEIMKLMGST